jgi:uncharacterized membrane protein YoaK (UPF0700 family)
MLRYERPLIGVAICLAALAGFVDAIGFLQLGGFFVSFMSGNMTRLGVGLATGSGQASIAAGLVLSFIVGAMGATLIAHATPRWRKPAVLGMVTLLLLAAVLAHHFASDYAALLLTAGAMGAENGVFQREGEVSIGLTYMTGTIVRFSQRAALAFVGGDRWAWVPHLLLWGSFLAGVLGGAHAYLLFGLNALWIAIAASTALTAALWEIVRHR